jgi:hypothetical protein
VLCRLEVQFSLSRLSSLYLLWPHRQRLLMEQTRLLGFVHITKIGFASETESVKTYCVCF